MLPLLAFRVPEEVFLVAVDQDLLDRIAGTLADLYRDVETALVRVVASELKKDLRDPSAAQVKLDAIRRLRAAAEAVVKRLHNTKSAMVREAIRRAYLGGRGSVLTDVGPWQKQLRAEAQAAAEQVPNLAVIERLAAALHRDLGRVDHNILRAPVDAYRAVQAGAAARIASGAFTRRQASQAAWSRLIEQGITSFTDSANRRWKLSSYVEMMARTNIQRAAVAGQTDRLAELDLDLVYVSDNVQECRVCRPFESKVLRRDAGPTGKIEVEHATRDDHFITVDVADTLPGAMAKGLFHPNCRHSVSAYLPGVTKLKKGTADPDGDKARQKQRYLERRIRAAKEQAAGALTPEAKKQAEADVRQAQAALRAHLKAHPALKRLPYREQVGAGNIPRGGQAPGGPVADLTPPPDGDGGAAARASADRQAAEEKARQEAAEQARREAEERARREAEERARREAGEKARREAVQNGDFSGLRKVGEQGGSNPGGLFEDADGVRWYVKTQQSEQHAANEIAAARLYREAGIDAPEIHQGRGAPGLPDGPQTASRIVDAREATPAELRKPAREGFGLDAWLANWDVAGLSFDNLLLDNDGNAVRIDTGGALLYRAQGDPKGAAFGDKVTEWDTLRDPATAPQAADLYKGMTLDEQAAALERLQRVTPDAVRRVVTESGLPDRVADTLIRRRDDLLARMPGIRAEQARVEQAKREAEEAARKAAEEAARRAAEEEARRRQAPGMRAGRRHTSNPEGVEYARTSMPLPADLTDDERQALRAYTGSDYSQINAALRDGLPSDPFHRQRVERQIALLDSAFAKAKLDEPIIVHRGDREGFAQYIGVDLDKPETMEALVGKVIVEKGYTSTSIGKNSAFNGAVYRVYRVPAGYEAINVMPISEFEEDEREIVVRSGSHAVVHAVYRRGPAWIMEMEIVPDGWAPPPGWAPAPYGDMGDGYTADGKSM